MSSFRTPHHLYIFDMTNGRKKIAYGASADEAFENLKLRLTEPEIKLVKKDQVKKISQREFRNYIHELG